MSATIKRCNKKAVSRMSQVDPDGQRSRYPLSWWIRKSVGWKWVREQTTTVVQLLCLVCCILCDGTSGWWRASLSYTIRLSQDVGDIPRHTLVVLSWDLCQSIWTLFVWFSLIIWMLVRSHECSPQEVLQGVVTSFSASTASECLVDRPWRRMVIRWTYRWQFEWLLSHACMCITALKAGPWKPSLIGEFTWYLPTIPRIHHPQLKISLTV